MSRSLLLILWSIALFAACITINGRHQQFPWYYHPDEPGKVEQVLEGEWNLHHPPLLLGTTKFVAQLTAATSEQRVVETGRLVSTIFIATAIVALSLLAYAWRGWAAALLTGALLATHHQLYELSHYFKEDSALLLGIAAAALALVCYGTSPSPRRAALLGIACALALSGKYLGAIMLLPAIAVMIRQRVPRGWILFACGFIVAAVILNWPLFSHLQTFRESFARETNLVVSGQGGATRSIPHSEYWTIFRDNTTPAIWILLAAFITTRIRDWRSLGLARQLVTVLPFLYTVALSFSPKTNDRYFLPASALFTLLAAIGACDLATRFLRAWVMPLTAALAIASQFPSWSKSRPGWLEYERAFQIDDNSDLIAFLKDQVPPAAVLLKDNRIALPDPARKKHASRLGVIPQQVIAKRFAADIGTLEKAREAGITHVIVSESDYGKFFRSSLRPQKGEEDSFTIRANFYRRLFKEGTELWRRDRGTVIYLHPGIIVYRL